MPSVDALQLNIPSVFWKSNGTHKLRGWKVQLKRLAHIVTIYLIVKNMLMYREILIMPNRH
jgi:hypothetical protein